MKKIIEKIYYPAIYGTQAEKDDFYAKLRKIEKNAISVDSEWEDFYYRVKYTLPNGEQWNYYENTDYGIPSRLERVA